MTVRRIEGGPHESDWTVTPDDLATGEGQAPRPVAFDCGEVVLRGDQWPGTETGRQVLLLHGGGQTRHSWGHTARELARNGWTTTALDLRGHGDSDWSPQGHYGVQHNADDIAAVIEQLGHGLVLVGASLGGLTSLAVQGADPTAARALVLVDVVPRTSPAGVQRIRDFMTRHLDGFASLEDVADAVAEYTHRERRTDISGLSKNVRLREDGRLYWHWDPRMVSSQRDLDTQPPIDPDALLELSRTISVPVLIVRGEQSDVVTHEGIAELTRAVKHAESVEVGGAGHMVAGDDNDVFTRAVREFLARLEFAEGPAEEKAMQVYESLTALAEATGQLIGTSDWIHIEQDRVDKFAASTGDHQWIHVDAERSKSGPFGTTIAHGYLTLSLIPALASSVFELAMPGAKLNYGLNRVRFPSPVPVGSRVRAHVTLVDVAEVKLGTQITMSYVIEIEGQERPACIAETLFLVPSTVVSEG